MATPSKESSFACVRDWRISENDSPVALFHGAEGVLQKTTDISGLRRHGMLMSLAMTESNRKATIIACGMESGEVAFHDLSMLKGPVSLEQVKPGLIQLDRQEAVLSLDVSPSSSPAGVSASDSLVAIAGLAGNVDDLLELPEMERGRVAVIKATRRQDAKTFEPRLRTRLSSCKIGESGILAKPGAATCRFRPGDGRVFAVGGWDRRVRIYDRATPRPLALLRGHTESVRAIDWAPDAVHSGLLASGSSDGRVYIWRCFPSSVDR